MGEDKMVKVTIEHDGGVNTYYGDAVLCSMVTDAGDNTSVQRVVCGTLNTKSFPNMYAHNCVSRILNIYKDDDVIDQMEKLAGFCNKVKELTDKKMSENADAMAELIRRILKGETQA